MSDSGADHDPVLAAIGRQLVTAVAGSEARRQRRRRRVVGAALAIGVVGGVVASGLVLTDRGRPARMIEAVGPSTTAGAEGAGPSDPDDRAAVIDPAQTPPILGLGPATVVDASGEPLDESDPAVGSIVNEVERLVEADGRYLGDDQAARSELLADGGLEIRTTIDAEVQELATVARSRTLAPSTPGVGPVGALVAVRPDTGAVAALLADAGAATDDPTSSSLAGLRAQSGSAFVPVLLAAAFEAGRLPDDTVDGTGPCEFSLPGLPDSYRVSNAGSSPGGVAPISQQVTTGSHCALMRLGLDVGLDSLPATAARLGFTEAPEPYPSLPLGAVEVSMLELATVNATLAAGGTRHDPYLIEEISQTGRVLYSAAAGPGLTALDAVTACRVTGVLRVVADAVPGLGGQQLAGISGGSPLDNRAYHAGYNPGLASVVWVGADDGAGQISAGDLSVGDLASRFWVEFNRDYLAKAATPATSFPDCPEPSRPPERITTAWD